MFKQELKDVLNQLIGSHNSIKQELFVIRNNQKEEEKKIDCLEKANKECSRLIIEKIGKTEFIPKSNEQAASTTSHKNAKHKQPPQSKIPQSSQKQPKTSTASRPSYATTKFSSYW